MYYSFFLRETKVAKSLSLSLSLYLSMYHLSIIYGTRSQDYEDYKLDIQGTQWHSFSPCLKT
jgi:hypothetical protein